MVKFNRVRKSVVVGLCAMTASFAAARVANATAVELSDIANKVSVQAQAAAEPNLTVSTASSAALSLVPNLVLRLSERRVSLYYGDMLVANYAVAVGREGWNTPTGEFSVFQKQVNPAWEHPFTGVVVPPGPDNPLGNRWIGFWSDGTNSIGFHGTPDESVIGTAVSHGCVRMRNEDVQALYEQVGLNTIVTVLP